MAGKLSKFQMIGFQSWKGLTTDNHLGTIFQQAPQMATNLMVQLLAFYRGKSLDSFLNQFPVKEFDDDREYYWNVIGSARRNISLIEARDEDGNVITASSGNVGVNTTPFYLVFGEDYFADGEVIVGNLNQVYTFRILAPGKSEGLNTAYKVELMGANTIGCPAERLLAGEKFSVEFAPVERYFSKGVGDVRFSSPVSMRNEFSTIRLQHEVAGNMLNKKLAFGIPMTKKGPDGNQIKDTTDKWMYYEDWAVEEQFSDYKNNVYAFATSNRNANGEYMNFGKSGVEIRQGAGIFEQCEVSNTIYYNDTHGVMKLLLDAIISLSASKLGFNERHFVVKTGEQGALIFNREAKDTASGWMPTYSTQNPPIYKKVNSAFNPNGAVSLTDYQVTEWTAPNGVQVTLDIDPLYDDPVRNKVRHPLGGVAMSYRFDIWYMGTMDQPNIQRCAVKNMPEVRSYQWGPRNPFTGQMGNPYMSFADDKAVIHKMATLGAMVLDPSRTISLIPAILAA